MNRWRVSRLPLWLALVVMLLGALAPAVSRTLVATGGDRALAIEVCTSDGPRWRVSIPADTAALTAPPSISLAADSPDGGEPALSLDHCPFCLLIAERLGPPPAASMHFFHAESGWVPPDAQALFFRSVLLTLALPRGPPIRS